MKEYGMFYELEFAEKRVIDMGYGIAIVGANGSGKTVLGRYLAGLLGYYHMDIEDYSFKDSTIPYSNPRTKEEVHKLLLADIEKQERFILSAVNCDFGDDINNRYRCVIYIKVPLETRLNRVKQRSFNKYGSRILEGGDMYEQEQKFFKFAASRTMDKTENWLQTLTCPVICIDGTEPVEVNAKKIKESIINLI